MWVRDGGRRPISLCWPQVRNAKAIKSVYTFGRYAASAVAFDDLWRPIQKSLKAHRLFLFGFPVRPGRPPFYYISFFSFCAIYTALKVCRTAHENITVHNGGGKGNYSASGSSTLPGTQMGGQSRRRDWLGSKLLGEGGGRSNSLDIRPVSSLLILSAAAFVHT